MMSITSSATRLPEVRKRDVQRITDGHLTEHWTIPDMLGLMQQLGALQSAIQRDPASQ